jgi:hypothetical protein
MNKSHVERVTVHRWCIFIWITKEQSFINYSHFKTMQLLRNVRLIVTRIALVHLEWRRMFLQKIPVAVINIIWKGQGLLQIGATDQLHCTRGSEAILCTHRPVICKSSIQVYSYYFLSESLWRLILKHKGVAWSWELLCPSLCGARHPSRQQSVSTRK